MPLWAVIPVKPFREAKSRLAAALSPDERANLSREFLIHTLDVLKQVPAVKRALVVSRDTAALQLARKQGAYTVTESGSPELNLALARAADMCISFGATAVLILPSDLPLLTPGDVAALIAAAGNETGVVIAPDRREQGTNALLARPPRAIPYAFGPGSLAMHVRLARERQMPVHLYRAEGLGLDVDRPEDLELYKASRQQVNR